jgi:hypothetical protein
MNERHAVAATGTPFSTALAVWLISGLASAAALLWILHFGPGGDVSICLFRSWTGVACPACGMTRAVSALLSGSLGEMISLHPLAPLVLLEAAIAWTGWGISLAVRRRGLDEAMLAQLLAANALLFVMVWLIRLVNGTLPS